MPVRHVIVYTGFGLALFLGAFARWIARAASTGTGSVMTYSLGCAFLMNVPFA